MRSHTGAIRIYVEGLPENQLRSVLENASQRIQDVKHPEEPDEPFASLVEVQFGEPTHLYIDAADAESYAGILEAILDAVVRAAEDAGPDGDVTIFVPGTGFNA